MATPHLTMCPHILEAYCLYSQITNYMATLFQVVNGLVNLVYTVKALPTWPHCHALGAFCLHS